MDFSKAFVAAMVAGGKDAYKAVIQKGIHPHFLEGEGRDAFLYVGEHAKNFAEIPSRTVILGKTGIDIGEADGKADFYIEECLTLRLHKLLMEGMQKVPGMLGQYKPKETLVLIEKMVADIHAEHLTYTPARSIFSHVPGVLAKYERMKAGERGIPFPFAGMNDATLGMWPQDLILFAARLGIGKSWSLLLIARAAWKAGTRVLLCTTEMSQERMAERFFAMDRKLPYAQFRNGSLNPYQESAMYEGLLKMMEKDDGRFRVLGGDFDFRMPNLQAEIEEFLPDLVIVDGAYLIESEGEGRTEKAANTFNALKRLANRMHIPIVVSSQFNREVKKNSPNTVQAESIGLTDVAGWNADVIFGLVQTEDMAKDKRMIFKPLKIREGKGEEFEVIWDIENMNFEELPKPGSEKGNPFDAVPHSAESVEPEQTASDSGSLF